MIGRANTGGSWLEYERHGERGPRVLLVMGMGASRLGWRGQVEDLGGDHQLLTFDNPGIGGSGPIRGSLSIRGMAEDTLRLLDHVGWERTHIVGISLGGMIAQELALAARDRVESLSLLTTHAGSRALGLPLPPADGLSLFVRQRVATMRGDRERHKRLLLELLFPAEVLDGPVGRRAADHIGTVFAGRDNVGTLQAQTWAAMRHDTKRRLRSLEGLRTLVVRSGRDRLISPAAQADLHRRIPGAELLNLPDAGHGALSQCREVINTRLRDWFAT